MNIKDLKEAGEFARNYGFKAVIYGPPGSAKTPLVNTAPRPLLLVTEPGMLSMRGSKVPAYEAYTEKAIDDFFDWFFNSTETKAFDTLAVDSTSQMADTYLKGAETRNSHGLKQYGDMAKATFKHLRRLYYTTQKHTYLIAKETETGGIKHPYWPGKDLNVNIPHLYDAIIRVARVHVPNVGEQLAFRCNGGVDVLARNRTGNLADFEPPDFGKLVEKAMSNGL